VALLDDSGRLRRADPPNGDAPDPSRLRDPQLHDGAAPQLGVAEIVVERQNPFTRGLGAGGRGRLISDVLVTAR
jgi:hypothetical protein